MKKTVFLIAILGFQFGFAQILENADGVSFQVIENVPVYSGCEDMSTNAAKKRCLSSKINKLVSRKFDTSISDGLDLPDGKVSIYVNFKIDKKGKVTDINARAPHKKLKEEAMRIIS